MYEVGDVVKVRRLYVDHHYLIIEKYYNQRFGVWVYHIKDIDTGYLCTGRYFDTNFEPTTSFFFKKFLQSLT